MSTKRSKNTTCQIGSQKKELLLGHISSPICLSTAFEFPDTQTGAIRAADINEPEFYGRWGSRNSREFEDLIAALENTDDAVCASSGLGIISMVLHAFLKHGDHIVAPHACYSESKILIDSLAEQMGIEVTYVESDDIEQYLSATRENTRLVYAETPANPTVSLVDIQQLADHCKQLAQCVFVVDSTFASPINQNPIDLGADIVLHSATKYIGGHSDVVAGVAAGAKSLMDKVRKTFSFHGPHLDPFAAWLLTRGVKTLGLRVERQNKNALKLAEWLHNNDEIEVVRYPYHPSHPQYELAKKQMLGGGGMICFTMKRGREAALNLVSNTEIIKMAVSLGGVRTTITHPASMTHNLLSDEELQDAGISANMIRFSVGIEDVDDLIADLEQAMSKNRL